MRGIAAYIVVCVAIIFLAGFDQETSEAEKRAIEQGVQIRVDAFIQRQRNDCKMNAIQVAERKVDSLIRVWARDQKVLDVDKPPKPGKPEMPEILTLPDTVNHELIEKKKNKN